MCLSRPKPPPLPEPRPTPPKPEKTAKRVLVSSNRPSQKDEAKKRTDQRKQRVRRVGTAMLRIPLTGKTNLRY